jgi:hypothetical protein
MRHTLLCRSKIYYFFNLTCSFAAVMFKKKKKKEIISLLSLVHAVLLACVLIHPSDMLQTAGALSRFVPSVTKNNNNNNLQNNLCALAGGIDMTYTPPAPSTSVLSMFRALGLVHSSLLKELTSEFSNR